MRIIWSVTAAVALGFAVASSETTSVLRAAAPQDRFRSAVEGVQVDVLVTAAGRPVGGLSAADFDLRDSGIPQRIQLMEIERLPLNLIWVFDASASVAGPLMTNLVNAAGTLIGRLDPRDRVALVTFSDRVRLLSALTPDRPAITAALRSLTAQGRTTLREGVFAGLALRERDPGRTLLLLFADGDDTASWLTSRSVLDAAKSTDVVVYPIIVRRPDSTRIPRHGFVGDLAEETGGRVVLLSSGNDLGATFREILAEFRDRYLLTYVPAGVPASGWHPIQVTLKNRHANVTARRGYFAE